MVNSVDMGVGDHLVFLLLKMLVPCMICGICVLPTSGLRLYLLNSLLTMCNSLKQWILRGGSQQWDLTKNLINSFGSAWGWFLDLRISSRYWISYESPSAFYHVLLKILFILEPWLTWCILYLLPDELISCPCNLDRCLCFNYKSDSSCISNFLLS